jgi:hypothetical protein
VKRGQSVGHVIEPLDMPLPARFVTVLPARFVTLLQVCIKALPFHMSRLCMTPPALGNAFPGIRDIPLVRVQAVFFCKTARLFQPKTVFTPVPRTLLKIAIILYHEQGSLYACIITSPPRRLLQSLKIDRM